jgi:hypothetical protein
MKNKVRDVIGREGCVINVQVKTSYTSASWLDEIVCERKETPLLTAQATHLGRICLPMAAIDANGRVQSILQFSLVYLFISPNIIHMMVDSSVSSDIREVR